MWSHFPLEIWLLESIRLILLCFQVMEVPYLTQFCTWKPLIFFAYAHFDILDWFYFAYAQYFDKVGLSIMIIEITNKLFPRVWSADFIFNEDHWWWKCGGFRNAYKYWIFVKVRLFREYIFPYHDYMMLNIFILPLHHMCELLLGLVRVLVVKLTWCFFYAKLSYTIYI